MIVAGIDPGTTSGIGIIRGQQLLHAEARKLAGANDGEVFHAFRGWLVPLLKAYDVEAVAIEEPLRTDQSVGVDADPDQEHFSALGPRPRMQRPTGNMRTFLRLYGLRGHAVEVFTALNLDWKEVNVRTWRGAVYGPTSPPKSINSNQRTAWWKKTALHHVNRYLNWPIKSADAAEAALIADWRRADLSPLAARVGQLPLEERAPA